MTLCHTDYLEIFSVGLLATDRILCALAKCQNVTICRIRTYLAFSNPNPTQKSYFKFQSKSELTMMKSKSCLNPESYHWFQAICNPTQKFKHKK